ncbi:hypothetical protein AB0J38_14240 [Streptomyces sp. NPDC050095]|uniref:hypothetical protein n=1 Tax=unclassified Streptomyces TaxID=2593676 RepID=UPI003427C914
MSDLPENARLVPMKPYPWAVGFHEAWDGVEHMPGLTASVRDIASRVQILAEPNGLFSKSRAELAGRGSTPNFAGRVLKALSAGGWLLLHAEHDSKTSTPAVWRLTRPDGVSDLAVFTYMSAVLTNDRNRRARARAALEKEYDLHLGDEPETDTPPQVLTSTQGRSEEYETPGAHEHPPQVSASTHPPVLASTPPPYMSSLEVHERAEVVETGAVAGGSAHQDRFISQEPSAPSARPDWLPSMRSSDPRPALVAHQGEGKPDRRRPQREVLMSTVPPARDDAETPDIPDVAERASQVRALIRKDHTA